MAYIGPSLTFKSFYMKKRYIFYFVLALGLGYLIYHRITENKKIEQGGGKSKRSSTLNVDGVVLKKTDFSNRLEITGSIEANESITSRSEISGLVTGIFFKEGGHVKKGNLLVKINDIDIRAQLQEAITKENLAASNENRAKQLLEKGAISQEEYDISLAELQILKSQIQLIKAQLAKTSIIAPFSGKVGLRSISVGEYITPNTVITNIFDLSTVKVNFSIPERYASQIKIGQNISFDITGSPETYTGKIYAIEPGVNPQTRTLQLKALATNKDERLIPGFFAKINLPLTTIEDAILIPTEAVIPVLDGKVVYTTKNGKATQVSIETGTRTAEDILVLSGLAVGDTVLTTGAMALRPGANVKVNITNN